MRISDWSSDVCSSDLFDGRGAEELRPDEQLLTAAEVRAWNPCAVITSSNAVPHFFPGVKVETFHGFDAGKPRHIYIRGFFDLYCTTGPRDTAAFGGLSRKLGHFTVAERSEEHTSELQSLM